MSTEIPATFRRVCLSWCWTPVKCSHGHKMHPGGRSVPLGTYECCDEYQTGANPRHLWDEHDDERWRFDPEGRVQHESECERCRPEVDEPEVPETWPEVTAMLSGNLLPGPYKVGGWPPEPEKPLTREEIVASLRAALAALSSPLAPVRRDGGPTAIDTVDLLDNDSREGRESPS